MPTVFSVPDYLYNLEFCGLLTARMQMIFIQLKSSPRIDLHGTNAIGIRENSPADTQIRLENVLIRTRISWAT